MPRKSNPFSPRGGPQQLLEQRHGYQLARATLAARGDARGASLADWRLQRLEGELDAFRATYRSLMGNAAEAFERLHEVSCPGVRTCPHAHRALWEVTQDRQAMHANPALARPRDTSKHAPGSMVLQTVIVSHAAARDGREARAIARRIARHDPGPAERTSQSWRFRQRNPEDFQRGTFRTLRLWPGVALVVGKLRRGAPHSQPRGNPGLPPHLEYVLNETAGVSILRCRSCGATDPSGHGTKLRHSSRCDVAPRAFEGDVRGRAAPAASPIPARGRARGDLAREEEAEDRALSIRDPRYWNDAMNKDF